jgi:hypothetical protein
MLALAVLGSQIAAGADLLSQQLPPIQSIDQLLADSILNMCDPPFVHDYRSTIIRCLGEVLTSW